ncbi:MAG: carboxypeptidase regulatory-like domain-containing protein [bacterium]|nr:carboxypeptidase regulatory-like domain-containing protein [bacterium]
MKNKKVLLLLLLFFLIPTFVFAVSNAKINGQKNVTITQLPVDLVFTADLAAMGNKLAFEYIIDVDFDGIISPIDQVVDFFYITDGIGWIRDPEDPDSDLAGDETGVDGKIRTSFTAEADDLFFPENMTIFLRVTDEDGSSDLLTIKVQVTPQPPFIQGKITDAVTGLAIPNVIVFAESLEEANVGYSDNNGDYKISVRPGSYQVAAMQMPMTQYQPSDTAVVTVSGTQSVTQNFALQPFAAKVNGKLTKVNGDPVPGILVLAMGDEFFSFAVSDANGDYSFGVVPGTVIINPSFLFNTGNENWPEDHYVDPQMDSVVVAQGQTATSNFVFKPYTSFVSGRCTANGTGLANVSIQGVSIDMTTFSMNFYETTSDQDGNYRLGVLPGVINSITAEIDGYDLQSPMTGGYFQVNVAAGQTVSGKDFTFTVSDPLSISGRVTFSDGSAASNVYVVANNYFEDNPQGFLITYTDGNGNFQFENPLDGDYQLGVYKSGYSSEPAMRYFYLSWGTNMTDQDFVLSPGTGVETRDNILKPVAINLFQNYPNPFNPTTNIRFQLSESEHVTITIFNTSGQIIRLLADGTFGAGQHQLEWDGRDHAGNKVSSGFYFYQLKTSGFNKVMRMILTK